MEILSHRGFWHDAAEKNTPAAFVRSFRAGFGTETDVRDRLGELVISHDMPGADALSFEAFLGLHQEHGAALTLALNIKADGLQIALKTLLEKYRVANYFVFDMAVPDALGFLKNDFVAFTRRSEHETAPSFLERAGGVWIDCFESDWVSAAAIRADLEAGKKVCLVSPDLHRRPHGSFWEMLRESGLHKEEKLLICTDFPAEARAYFYDH